MRRRRSLVRLKRPAAVFCFLSFALLFFSACASSKSRVGQTTGNGRLFAVSSSTTSFYRYGPQQGNGPDESLPKDTLMTLIRPSFGYCKVQLVATSKEGYVASEDIKPAPATLIAALNAPVRNTADTREDFNVRASDPPPPEALPDPDLPPASTEPSPQ